MEGRKEKKETEEKGRRKSELIISRLPVSFSNFIFCKVVRER